MSEPRSVRGFMCKIDWDHELGEASGGTRVYASITDLKREHEMCAEYGIVEVIVTFVDERVPENYDWAGMSIHDEDAGA